MKKLLITGYVRSGTTLLANFLNSQKDCLIYRDFLGLLITPSPRLKITSFLMPLTEQQKNVLLSEIKERCRCFGSNILDNLDKKFSNLKELYEKALCAMNKEGAHKVVGSKITRLGKKLPTLLKEANFYVLYIYRDVRDVLLSDKYRSSKHNLIYSIAALKSDLENALQIENKRMLKIKFEDLILDTDSVIGKLSDFLGINITKDISVAKDRETDWISNSSFHDINQLFDKKACYRWKNYKDSKEVKYCEILIPQLIKRLGYDMYKTKYSIFDNLAVYKDFYIPESKKMLKKFLKLK